MSHSGILWFELGVRTTMSIMYCEQYPCLDKLYCNLYVTCDFMILTSNNNPFCNNPYTMSSNVLYNNNNCDPIWEKPHYCTKMNNWVISSTEFAVLRSTEWWLGRGDQAFHCWDTAVNSLSIHKTVHWDKPIWSLAIWACPYISITCKTTPTIHF